MRRFGVEPERKRTRREFHGDRTKVEINVLAAYSWVPYWVKVVKTWSPDCRRQFEELEPQLNQFGYSYLNPYAIHAGSRVRATPNYVSFTGH